MQEFAAFHCPVIKNRGYMIVICKFYMLHEWTSALIDAGCAITAHPYRFVYIAKTVQ